VRTAAAVAVLLAAVLHAGGPAAAEVPPVPEPVTAWLETEGRALVATSETSGLPPEALDAADIGPATSVHVWSDDYAAGRAWDQAVVPSGDWVAPILLDGAGVGAIVVTREDGGPVTDPRIEWDDDLGSDLAAFQSTAFVRDEASGGWFRLGGEILTPVTAKARELLAGSIGIADYQRYLVARLGGDGQEPAVPVEPDGGQVRPVATVAGVLLGLLAIVGVIVWVRRPDDGED